jgi:hypothetical protein
MSDCRISESVMSAINVPTTERRGWFSETWLWIAGCYGILNVVAHREFLRLCIWMRLLNT